MNTSPISSCVGAFCPNPKSRSRRLNPVREKSGVPVGVLWPVLGTGLTVRTVSTREASWIVKCRDRCGFRGGSKRPDGAEDKYQGSSSFSSSSVEEEGVEPLRQPRAEERCSDNRRSWPEMKGAEVDWPVQRVMSIRSREALRWLARLSKGVIVRSGVGEWGLGGARL